ncbi:hypothetical protein FQA39_LY02324 [Lamprigera yunnana]|nr:hypothetical protein FQA39_LY02324 [Lamprigera yunnana]
MKNVNLIKENEKIRQELKTNKNTVERSDLEEWKNNIVINGKYIECSDSKMLKEQEMGVDTSSVVVYIDVLTTQQCNQCRHISTIKQKVDNGEVVSVGHRYKCGDRTNLRRLNGKEMQLINEYEMLKIKVLAITETKRKGITELETENGHLKVLIRVQSETRAQTGVDGIIDKDIRKY